MPTQDRAFNTARAEEGLAQSGGQDPINAVLPKGVIVSGTTNGTANTEDAFAHGLGRVPTGFIVISADKAGSVYDGGTANTSALIHLKGSAVSIAFKILVF